MMRTWMIRVRRSLVEMHLRQSLSIDLVTSDHKPFEGTLNRYLSAVSAALFNNYKLEILVLLSKCCTTSVVQLGLVLKYIIIRLLLYYFG